MFCKKRVHEYFAKFTGQDLCWNLKLQACNFVKKETPTRVLSCERRKIFKIPFLYRTPVAASIGQRLVLLFVTNHTGRTVFFLSEIILPEPQFIIIPLLPILR